MFDSLPASFAPDSTLAPSWYDSARSDDAGRGFSMRASTAARDGTTRQNLSARKSAIQGVSGEIQHADPGGLRRRSLSWRGEAFRLGLGDLGPWADHPLLEGTSLVSGPRDTSLDRQFLYGSGTAPNGIDLSAKRASLRLLARQRIERGESGSPRLSSAGVAELGPVSLGLRVADSGTGARASQVASLGLEVFGMRGEAAWLDPFGAQRAFAIHGQGRFESKRVRADVQVRHLASGFRHDGLSRRWKPGSALSASLRRELATDLGLSLRLDGARDSLGKVGARTRTSLHLDDTLFDLRLAGSWSENMSSSPRWSVGSQLGFERGAFAPALSFAFSDSARGPAASVRLELGLHSGSQELSISGSHSTNTGPRWTGLHKTTFEAGNSRLEFILSVSGSPRRDAPLNGQGSLAYAW